MKACAAWLKTLIPEVPVEALPVGDPYWNPARMTAQEIVTRIRQSLPSRASPGGPKPWTRSRPAIPRPPVSGIATTGMATFDVLKRAAKAGRNFVITHEPTFYNHQDQTAAFEQDATYQAKQRFIREHNLVVWRFHDHAHAIRPDPLVVGSARMLGWSSLRVANRAAHLRRPADHAAASSPATSPGASRDGRFASPAIPTMKVTRIALGPGYGVPALTAGFDVSVGGEAPESGGNAEYVEDATAIGQPKGVIVLGHMMSEDWGMREVGDWLRGVPHRRADRLGPCRRAVLVAHATRSTAACLEINRRSGGQEDFLSCKNLLLNS